MSNPSLIQINKQLRLKTANDFFINGINIFHKILTLGNPNSQILQTRIWQLPSPIVNISFSVEICLKALLPNNKRGHELHKLYLLINSSIKKKIEDHFLSCKTFNLAIIDFVITEGNKPEFPPAGTISEIIEETLRRCTNNFVDFRYLYELSEKYIYFLSNNMIRIAHSCIFVLADEINVPFDELMQPEFYNNHIF